MVNQSPEFVRTSTGAAMMLGFKKGFFYRDAVPYCVNLLLDYEGGCFGRCAFCGLARGRDLAASKKGQSFIRVAWPSYSLDEIAKAIPGRPNLVKRICVSMITHARAAKDTAEIVRRLRSATDAPISVLVSPTVIEKSDLEAFKAAGADKIGVAIDACTPALFERLRGHGVKGPHKWERYWECLAEAADVFGRGNIGAHLIAGIGETEEEMARAIQRMRDMGGETHLFSFYPEPGSAMESSGPPAMDAYRRIQIARYLVDKDLARADAFSFGEGGRIESFGIAPAALEAVIASGEPFRTSGCVGRDGTVACNRPFANAPPGPDFRNYPFAPEKEDLERIREQMEGSAS